MAAIGRYVTNFMKTAVSSISPFKVEEMTIEDFNKVYKDYKLVEERHNFLLYEVANHFDAIFAPSTASAYCERKFYSIFRLQQKSEATDKFKHCADVIDRLDEAQCAMTRKKQGLEKIIEVCRMHPTWNAAHVACHLGLKECLRMPRILELMNEADQEDGVLPLHVAMEANVEEIIRILLGLSMLDVCAADRHGNTVVHVCVRKNNPTILKLLLSRAAIVEEILNAHNSTGKTALHLACEQPCVECARLLLEAGCDPLHSFDELGFPLHYAVRSKSVELVKLLCSRKPEQVALQALESADTPLHCAESLEMVLCLCKLGAPVNKRNKAGRTALHKLLEKRDLGIVMTILLMEEFDPNVQDNDGLTLLHLAVQYEDVDIVRALIVFEADVNLLSAEGHSPRHLLCRDSKQKYISGKERNLLLFTLSAVGARRCPPGKADCTDGCSAEGKFEGTPPSPILDPASCTFNDVDSFIERTHLSRHRNMAADTTEKVNPAVRVGEVETDSPLPMFARPTRRRGLRLLSLDGGGMRGLILTQLLLSIQQALGPDRSLKDCFDWIAGTSTGGFVALGLMRGMTLRELRRLYFLLKDQVFQGKRPYASEPFENIIKQYFGETAKMYDISHPKVVVTALLSDRFPPVLHMFRNYPAPVDELYHLALTRTMDTSSQPIPRSNEPNSSDGGTSNATTFYLSSQPPASQTLTESTEENDNTRECPETDTPGGVVPMRKSSRACGDSGLPSRNAFMRHRGASTQMFNLAGWRDEKTTSLFHSASNTLFNALEDPNLDPVDLPEDQLVWKAARASGAAPTFFRACGRFLDGGLVANNPSLDLLTEVQESHTAAAIRGEPHEPMALLVSLGTGIIPTTPVGQIDLFWPNGPFEVLRTAMGASSLGKILVEMATASEGRPVERTRAWCASLNVPFFRFSPPLSADISLDCQDTKVLLQMLWETQMYLVRSSDKISLLASLL